jgi:hypothetical protein
MAYLRLPRDLQKSDAERIATFVRSLVVEPTGERPRGGGEGD